MMKPDAQDIEKIEADPQYANKTPADKYRLAIAAKLIREAGLAKGAGE